MSAPPEGALFDKSDEYEAMLARGLRLSGENRHYFIEGRLLALRDLLGPAFRPRRVLDFDENPGYGAAIQSGFARSSGLRPPDRVWPARRSAG